MNHPEELYRQVARDAAAEVNRWPEWRRNPTLVPRDQRWSRDPQASTRARGTNSANSGEHRAIAEEYPKKGETKKKVGFSLEP